MVRFFVRVRVIRHQAEGIQSAAIRSSTRTTRGPVESNKLHLEIFGGPKIHNQVFATLQSLQPISAASQHLNFSRQAGSLSVSDSGRSAVFFPPALRLDCRSWLSQTGISLPSGALRSWWIRLELNPVAPAILRIDRPA